MRGKRHGPDDEGKETRTIDDEGKDTDERTASRPVTAQDEREVSSATTASDKAEQR